MSILLLFSNTVLSFTTIPKWHLDSHFVPSQTVKALWLLPADQSWCSISTFFVLLKLAKLALDTKLRLGKGAADQSASACRNVVTQKVSQANLVCSDLVEIVLMTSAGQTNWPWVTEKWQWWRFSMSDDECNYRSLTRIPQRIVNLSNLSKE